MSKHKDNEEFKPNVIEPIEGQMRYDELLMPQKEEKVQEKDVSVLAQKTQSNHKKKSK